MKYLRVEYEHPIVDVNDALADLIKQVDGTIVDRIAADLATVGVDKMKVTPPYPEFPDQASLWGRLLVVLERELETLQKIQGRYVAFSNAFLGETTNAGRLSQLATFARELANHPLATTHEKKPIRSDTDYEAIQYRYQRLENRIEAKIRICCQALARVAEDIVERTDADAAICQEFVRLRRVQLLKGLLVDATFPHHRWLSLEAVAPFLKVVLRGSPEDIPVSWLRVLTGLNAAEHESWLEISVINVLGHDREEGKKILIERLRPRPSKDDWHTRAASVYCLFDLYLEDTGDIFEPFIEGEESDGVLIAIARRAAESPDRVRLFTELVEKQDSKYERLRANVAKQMLEQIGRGDDSLAPIVLGMMERETSSVVLEVFLHKIALAVPSVIPPEQLKPLIETRLKTDVSPPVANSFVRILCQTETNEKDPLEDLKPGESVVVNEDLPTLRRRMIRAADSGFGLYAKKSRRGYKVTRGEKFRPKAWRVLHEIRRPAPDKRQGHDHLKGRTHPGNIRAHPFDLAEVTPTTVPGERKLIRSEESSGYYLPSIDDVLDAQLSRDPIEVLSPHGLLAIHVPESRWSRLKNYFRITWNYRMLDQQRFASLSGDDAAQRSRFTATLRDEYDVEFSVESHAWMIPTHARETLTLPDVANAMVMLPAAIFSDLSDRLTRTVQVSDLAIALVATFILFLGRLAYSKYWIERWRGQIPVSVGGWGTRGKSGTERLKAGMFHGLGYDVFVKTTGCEAMFIHSARNLKAREIFIYRPYGKATIWEQRDVLALAAKVQADVFLWECMALNPRYVNLLQSHWMRDDIVTLTNAYPDHEDIQGPTGMDVAETISQFIPYGKKVLTTEREMYPVFEVSAKEKRASLTRIAQIEEHLFSNDILDRFPYQEHPRNIALVKHLAMELGIEPVYATFKMADNVVADLGVLKVYPEVNVFGRRLSFINGCSANERAGFMANWTRLKMVDLNEKQQPYNRVYTVVNNRGDRIARSKVFADILANDIAVDGHFLIGTNLAGLKNYLSESIDTYLANYVIIEKGEAVDIGRKRLVDLLARVRMHASDNEYLKDQLVNMSRACPVEMEITDADLDAIFENLKVGSYAEALQSVESNNVFGQLAQEYSTASEVDDLSSALAPFEQSTVEEVLKHWAELAANVMLARALVSELEESVAKGAADQFSARMKTIWKEKFLDTVHPIENAKATGDQIVVEIAKSTVPGCGIKLMGSQNIKGTGLDFVYRWVYLQETINDLELIEKLGEAQLRDAFVALATFESQGLMEVLEALRTLKKYTSNHTISAANKQFLESAISHLSSLSEKKGEAAKSAASASGKSRTDKVKQTLEKWLDPFDAIYRRTKADALKRRFARQQLSHAKMAEEMKKLTLRQKGGWL